MDPNEFGFEEEAESAPAPMKAAAQAMLQEMENPQAVDPVTDDSYLDDVDRRLDVASTYRQLLRAPLFDFPNESTIIVEAAIRQFVVQKLKELLNMGSQPEASPVAQPVQLPFDEQELKTLKILLSSLAERAAQKAGTPSAPQVAKATPTAPTAPQAPSVRRAVAPAPLPALPPTAAPKPVGRPPGRPPKAAPVEEDLKEMEDPRSGQVILTKRPKRQVRSRGAIPMPTAAEMEMVLEAQARGSGAAMGANATAASITSNIPGLGAQLVANALTTEE